ncbi:MAG TPA: DUF4399 domain-containing protein [Gammaproteobacteria bacterium]
MVHRIVPILLMAALAACGGSDGGAAPEPGGGAAPSADAAPPAAEPAEAPAPAPAVQRKPAPPGASVYIISPEDGAVVSNPVRVVFGLKGAGVAPAGIARPDAGHHHLLIDTEPPPFDAPIPADEHHVHFGMGQTETELMLTPGQHTLQLLLGDEAHVPHDPPLLSEPVTIQVQ